MSVEEPAQEQEQEAVALPVEETPFEIKEAQEALKPFFRIPLQVTIELGRGKLKIRELLDLKYHSVFGLNKLAGSNLDIFANNVFLGRGEVVITEDRVGLRISEIVESDD